MGYAGWGISEAALDPEVDAFADVNVGPRQFEAFAGVTRSDDPEEAGSLV
jgi:hypothetical protein